VCYLGQGGGKVDTGGEVHLTNNIASVNCNSGWGDVFPGLAG